MIDRNHDGVITFDEFIVAVINKLVLATQDNIDRTFKYIDENGDEFITYKELYEAFSEIPIKMTSLIKNTFFKDHHSSSTADTTLNSRYSVAPLDNSYSRLNLEEFKDK